MNSNTIYDKIKHLVEIEDDIFAVFTINSIGDANGLTVAKNIDFENSLIENIYTNFNKILKQDDKIIDTLTNSSSDLLGKSKWKVIEYEKIRILQIVDKDKTVVVLIKSNTSLDETVDNILVIIMRKKKTIFQKVCFDIFILSCLDPISNLEFQKSII